MAFKDKKDIFIDKHKKLITVLFLILSLVFCGVITWFIGRPMIEFVSEPEKFRNWVDSHGVLGRISFVLMMAFQVIIALVPGEPLEIGAGYAFGAIEGTFLCILGITLGSVAVFYLVRRFGMRFIEIFFDREKISGLKFLKNSKKQDILMFLIFFLPGTPKDLVTYFAGLTDIKITHFLWLASVARIPSVITSVLGGNALGGKDYVMAIIVFAVTLLISGIGLVVYRKIQTKIKKKP